MTLSQQFLEMSARASLHWLLHTFGLKGKHYRPCSTARVARSVQLLAMQCLDEWVQKRRHGLTVMHCAICTAMNYPHFPNMIKSKARCKPWSEKLDDSELQAEVHCMTAQTDLTLYHPPTVTSQGWYNYRKWCARRSWNLLFTLNTCDVIAHKADLRTKEHNETVTCGKSSDEFDKPSDCRILLILGWTRSSTCMLQYGHLETDMLRQSFRNRHWSSGHIWMGTYEYICGRIPSCEHVMCNDSQSAALAKQWRSSSPLDIVNAGSPQVTRKKHAAVINCISPRTQLSKLGLQHHSSESTFYQFGPNYLV